MAAVNTNMRLDATASRLLAMGLINAPAGQTKDAPSAVQIKRAKADELLARLQARVDEASKPKKVIKPKAPRPRADAKSESESDDEDQEKSQVVDDDEDQQEPESDDPESDPESDSEPSESESESEDEVTEHKEPKRMTDAEWKARCETIRDFADAKMKQHGLTAQGWRFSWNKRLTTTGGRCFHSKKCSRSVCATFPKQQRPRSRTRSFTKSPTRSLPGTNMTKFGRPRRERSDAREIAAMP